MDKIKLKSIHFYFLFFLFLIPFLMGQNVIATPSQNEYCAFCDSQVLERQKFYEDDLVMALYTHKPIFPGHCLIIPKRHIQCFEDLSVAETNQMMHVIKKVNQAVRCTFHTSSYLLLQKNGPEVGQTVPHVHFHYIPRKTGDTSTLKFMFKMYITNLKRPLDLQNMEIIVSELKQSIEKNQP